MALNLHARLPATLLRFGRADPERTVADEARAAEFAEQVTTAFAVVLAVAVVLSIAMLLGMT